MGQLKIRLFGNLELHRDAVLLPKPSTLKSQSLLAYLLVHRHQAHSRDKLAGLFWGERPERKARQSLSNALWHIRHALSAHTPAAPEYILADVHQVRFNTATDYWLDVEEFERLADSRWQMADGSPNRDAICHLQSAISLYRGNFLEDFYDDWCVDERYRLEARFLTALTELIVACRALGDFEASLAYACRLLQHDPLREDVHVEVMRLYCELGDRNAALQQYQRCRAILARELGVEPMPETTALFDDIREGRLQVRRPARAWRRPEPPERPEGRGRHPLEVTERPPLVGRERELAQLAEAWQRAAAGQGGLLLVSGEAGVGKTRLVERLAESVRWRGSRVLWGRCYAYERSLPYQPLSEALRAVLPLLDEMEPAALSQWWILEMTRLLPELQERLADRPADIPLEPGLEQARLFEAVARFLGRLAESAPILLVLEDVHWGAESTLAFLHFAARHLRTNSILAVGTFRPEEVAPGHPLQRLREELRLEALVEELDLARLSSEAVEALLRGMSGLGEAAKPLAWRLYHQTEGNPFFLTETVRALFEMELLSLVDGVWAGDLDALSEGRQPLPLPRTVREAIESRLSRLSETAREVLRVAAVAGREFDFDVLQSAWTGGEETTLRALDELLRRQLIREGISPAGRDYEFNHHLIQEVVYQGLSRPQRQWLHQLVGEAMEACRAWQLGEVAVELAYHFEAAGAWERAVTYLLRAGDRARRAYANQDALTRYDRALEILRRQFPTRGGPADVNRWRLTVEFDLLAAREEVLHLLGRREDQTADLAAMADIAQALGDPLRQAQALDRRAAFALALDQYAEAEEAAQAALALHRAQGNRPGESTSLVALGRARRAAGDYPRALAHWQAALAIRQETDDRAGQGETLSYIGGVYYIQGDYHQALAHWERALAIQQQTGERAAEALGLTHIGLAHEMVGDYAQALSYQDQALTLHREIGYRHGEALALANLASHACLAGDYAQALHHGEEVLAIFEALGQRRGLAATLDTLGNAYAGLGDYPQALAHLERGLALFREIGERWGEGVVLSSLGRAYLAQGEPQAALDRLTQAEAIHRALGQIADAALDRSYQAVAHLGLGRLDEARRCSEEALTTLEAGPEENLDRLKRVCWHRYLVLSACEPQAAGECLRRAHDALLAQADRISDAGLRANFLARVKINQEIVQEASQLDQPVMF